MNAHQIATELCVDIGIDPESNKAFMIKSAIEKATEGLQASRIYLQERIAQLESRAAQASEREVAFAKGYVAGARDQHQEDKLAAAHAKELERLYPHTGTADSTGHGQPL